MNEAWDDVSSLVQGTKTSLTDRVRVRVKDRPWNVHL